MNEKKKEFVEALSEALKMDSRSGVVSITYATDIWFEDVLYEEVIQVNFKGRAYKLINVTANSYQTNAREIINAVYDDEVCGLLFYGFEEEYEAELWENTKKILLEL